MSDNTKTELPLDEAATRLERRRSQGKRPKRKKTWRVILFTLSALVLVGVGLGVYYASSLKQSFQNS